jgi:hypothetical protein
MFVARAELARIEAESATPTRPRHMPMCSARRASTSSSRVDASRKPWSRDVATNDHRSKNDRIFIRSDPAARRFADPIGKRCATRRASAATSLANEVGIVDARQLSAASLDCWMRQRIGNTGRQQCRLATNGSLTSFGADVTIVASVRRHCTIRNTR